MRHLGIQGISEKNLYIFLSISRTVNENMVAVEHQAEGFLKI